MQHQAVPLDYTALYAGNNYLVPAAGPSWFNPFEVNWLKLFFQWVVPIALAVVILLSLKERYDYMQRVRRVNPWMAQQIHY